MAKMKKSLTGGNMIETTPKKLVRGLDNTLSMLLLAEIMLRSVIVDKGDKYICIKS